MRVSVKSGGHDLSERFFQRVPFESVLKALAYRLTPTETQEFVGPETPIHETTNPPSLSLESEGSFLWGLPARSNLTGRHAARGLGPW